MNENTPPAPAQRQAAPASGPPGIPSPHPGPQRRGAAFPRWPLAVIASPAAVAVWSGWVGLGGLCGFGEIHPLPGIWDSLQLNTAITLPVGIESYGAYALAAWLVPGTGPRAREFAGRSALGSLGLGMAGQAAYHLLAAAHARSAPWWVTMIVSCIPVATLALATALAHLLRTDTTADTAPDAPDSPAGNRPDISPTLGSRDTPDTAAPALSGAMSGAMSDDTASRSDRGIQLDAPAVPAPSPDPAPGADGNGTSDSGLARRSQPRRRRDVTDIEAQALAELSASPDLSGAELARRLDINPRRGQRLVGRLTPRLAGADAADGRVPQDRWE